ncbi:MAG: hypothetical protein NTY09_09220 [bacterium]|nr:hypothetical protein [bacterium]
MHLGFLIIIFGIIAVIWANIKGKAAQELTDEEAALTGRVLVFLQWVLITGGVVFVSFQVVCAEIFLYAKPLDLLARILAGLGFFVLVLVQGITLGLVQRLKPRKEWWWFVFWLIPIVNFVMPLVLVRQALGVLRKKAVSVGFLGPNNKDLEKLNAKSSQLEKIEGCKEIK